MVLHQPVKRHVFNVRTTDQRQAEKAVAHLNSMGVTRVSIVYADDSFGIDGIMGAERGMPTAKLKPVAVEKFDRNTPDFAPIAPRIYQSNTQAIVMVAPPQAMVDGIKAFRAAGSTAQIVTLSNNASRGFIKSLGENGRGVIVSQVFPNERSSLRRNSIVQCRLKFPEFFRADSLLYFRSQFPQLGQVACGLHRQIQAETTQAQAGRQPRGNRIGP